MSTMLLSQLKDEYISRYIPFFLYITYTHTQFGRNSIQVHGFINRIVMASEVKQNTKQV